ncbi:MAG: carbamoyltransferase C-terminal domain-containing protein [Patescibacteria group bacterium]
MSTYVLGLNFAYHELSACLLKDGKLVAAVEEERFSRIKRGKKALVDNPNTLPKAAIAFCLETAGIALKDVEYIGLSFFPDDRLKNIGCDQYFIEGDWGSEKGERLFNEKIKRIPKMLSDLAGTEMTTRVMWIPHHICHASSAFFVSPFRKAAVLSIDGIGEFSSTWLGWGDGTALHALKEISYPNSVGFLWEKISQYLGFTEYDSSKVMGLAAYGDAARFYPQFQKIVTLLPDGEFALKADVLRFRVRDFSELEKLFGVSRIESSADVRKDQEDIAAALQKITDDVIMHIVQHLKKVTKMNHLCLAGGVALNCVSNARIMQSGLFKKIFVQPAANDAGTALGAAHHIWNDLLGHPRTYVLKHSYWGPSYTNADIQKALKQANIQNIHCVKNIHEAVARQLADGNIVGWFQGRVEWGPRALGNRSLLADPRRADMKMILNERIKKRESFRPFAPSILAEHASQWFSVPRKCTSRSTECMIINFDVKKSKRVIVPAITHADGTARVQLVNKKTNPRYHKLISAFYKRTGVPLVLNTSFNDNEPIVNSPEDAIKTFLRTKMDALAIGNYLVTKQ